MTGLINADITDRILSAAFKVHRHLGPGLLESAYRECLVRQLTLEGMNVTRERPIAISYEGLEIPTAFRADVVVNDAVLIELKAVAQILPIHEAQTLTYLLAPPGRLAAEFQHAAPSPRNSPPDRSELLASSASSGLFRFLRVSGRSYSPLNSGFCLARNAW